MARPKKESNSKQAKAFKIPKPTIPQRPKHDNLLSIDAKESLLKYNEKRVIFSWQFFDRANELFNCGKAESNWFISLIDTMRSVSQMDMTEFRTNTSTALRVHPHKWDRIKIKYPLPHAWLEQLEQDTLQFSVSQAKGRVHGFVIENVFYIIWLDRHHNLYPDERHGGLKYCPEPSTCYECLEEEKEALQKQYDELYSEFDKLAIENDKLRSQIG